MPLRPLPPAGLLERRATQAFKVSEDVTAAILGNLDARDLARAAAASRGWRRCTSSRPLWASIYARDFMGHFPSPAKASGTDGGNHARTTILACVGDGGGIGQSASRMMMPVASAVADHAWPLGRAASAPAVAGFWGGNPRAFVRRYGSAGVGGWAGYDAAGGGGGGSGGVGTGIGVSDLMMNPKEQYAKQLTERRARLEKQQRVRAFASCRLLGCAAPPWRCISARTMGHELGARYVEVSGEGFFVGLDDWVSSYSYRGWLTCSGLCVWYRRPVRCDHRVVTLVESWTPPNFLRYALSTSGSAYVGEYGVERSAVEGCRIRWRVWRMLTLSVILDGSRIWIPARLPLHFLFPL